MGPGENFSKKSTLTTIALHCAELWSMGHGESILSNRSNCISEKCKKILKRMLRYLRNAKKILKRMLRYQIFLRILTVAFYLSAFLCNDDFFGGGGK